MNARAEATAPPRVQRLHPARIPRGLAGLALIGGSFYLAAGFPVGPGYIMAGLVIYLLLAAVYPASWLVLVPALIPVPELSFWSGRLYLTELDFFLATALGAALVRHGGTFHGLGRGTALLAAAFLAYNIFVTWHGVFPLAHGGLGAWQDMLSSAYGLREAKGFFWALAFLPALAAHRQRGADTWRLFALGMLAGLVLAALTIAWERWLFTGLFNLGSEYRVSGWFFDMVTGGAALDAYLILVTPFAALPVLRREHWALQLLGMVAGVLALYCLYVTYSRANYPAGIAVAGILAAGAIRIYRQHRLLDAKRVAALATVAALFLALAVKAVMGTNITERFGTVREDLQTRLDHWQGVLQIVDDTPDAWLYGVGRGRFPLEAYWQSVGNEAPLTTPALSEAPDKDHLVLRPGADDGTVYIRQRFKPTGSHELRLQLRARAPGRERVLVEFCQRHILK